MPPEALSTARPTPLRLWGFLLTATGGALAGIGAVLDWAVVGFPSDAQRALDVPVKGIDVWEGKVVLAAALLALVGTVAMRLTTGRRAPRSLAVAVVVLGTLAAALALSVALRPEARLGGGEQLDERVELGLGVWLSAAGGILVAGGGSLGLSWARGRAEDPGPGGSGLA